MELNEIKKLIARVGAALVVSDKTKSGSGESEIGQSELEERLDASIKAFFEE